VSLAAYDDPGTSGSALVHEWPRRGGSAGVTRLLAAAGHHRPDGIRDLRVAKGLE
jgi:hypothetical protein